MSLELRAIDTTTLMAADFQTRQASVLIASWNFNDRTLLLLQIMRPAVSTTTVSPSV